MKKHKKYEYLRKVAYHGYISDLTNEWVDNKNQILKEYGLKGWELCATEHTNGATGLYFKRRIK